ncbi:MAG: ThiF family adenylyltransferase [Thermoplasmata archaeon]
MDDDRFDRSRRIPWLDLRALSCSNVLMVGAGALGNEVAKNLALSGFGRMTVVDMDHVVGSNLNRCLFFSDEDARCGRSKAVALAEGVERLAPGCRAAAYVGKIEDVPSAVLAEHDIVLGCLDNVDARIYTNACAYSLGRVYIDGATDGLRGKVMVTTPPEGACLQCGMNRTHAKIANARFSCTGRDVVFYEPRLAAEITTTSVISAVMVREAMKAVSGRRDMMLRNTFYYDGERNLVEELEVEPDPDCPVHGRAPGRYR